MKPQLFECGVGTGRESSPSPRTEYEWQRITPFDPFAVGCWSSAAFSKPPCGALENTGPIEADVRFWRTNQTKTEMALVCESSSEDLCI